MKKIPLKKHATIEGLNTKELIKTSLEAPPKGGFTTTEIRERLKILDKLDQVNPASTVIELEDSEHAALSKAFAEVTWMKLEPFIIEFEDSLK